MKDTREVNKQEESDMMAKAIFLIGFADEIKEKNNGPLDMSEKEFDRWVDNTPLEEIENELLRDEKSLDDFSGGLIKMKVKKIKNRVDSDE